MEEKYEVEVQLPDGETALAQCVLDLTYIGNRREAKLTLTVAGREVSSTEDDYFDAMCGVRRVLEQEGMQLRCYGASLNVYPSGMLRDMAVGLKPTSLPSAAKANSTTLFRSSSPDRTCSRPPSPSKKRSGEVGMRA